MSSFCLRLIFLRADLSRAVIFTRVLRILAHFSTSATAIIIIWIWVLRLRTSLSILS